MISIAQIELNVCREYIRRVKETVASDAYYANRFLLILQIREWQLKRKLLNRLATLDDLQTLKHGHREAERFLLDIDKDSRKDVIAEIETILQLLGLEFFAEIQQIEEQHPERKAEFAQEREAYRLMWNAYVKDAQEAEF
jgi:hypothetical protein